MPPKNGLEFFPTPDELADTLVEGCFLEGTLQLGDRILEPSAGMGSLVDALIRELQSFDIGWAERYSITAVEINEYMAANMKAKYVSKQGVEVVQADFMSLSLQDLGGTPFKVVVMNPPFTGKEGSGANYIGHILHAYHNFLAPGGVLLAIAPNSVSFKSDKKTAAFRDLIELKGGFWANPDDVFKESGTGVKIVSLELDKAEDDEVIVSVVAQPTLPVTKLPSSLVSVSSSQQVATQLKLF